MTVSLSPIPLVAAILSLSASSSAWALESHFECKDLGRSTFRPYYLQAIDDGSRYVDYSQTPKGLLGQNPMTSLLECQRASDAANVAYGVICSRTGLDGWKPTIYTGTLPGRADYGYLGGSTIDAFDDCLMATSHSSSLGVCFWGGSDWFVAPIDREGVTMGPFDSVEECVTHTTPRGP